MAFALGNLPNIEDITDHLALTDTVMPVRNARVYDPDVENDDAKEFRYWNIMYISWFGLCLLIVIISSAYDLYNLIRDYMDDEQFFHRNLNLRFDGPRTPFSRGLLWFSVGSTYQRLTRKESKYPIEGLSSLRGIRFILGLWYAGSVIYYLTAVVPILNPRSLNSESSNVLFAIYNSTFSVLDPYLWISGVYACISILSELAKGQNRYATMLKLILNRALSYLPMLWALILTSFFIATIGNGPVFSEIFYYNHNTVRQHWYSYLLFMDNLLPIDHQGMIWASFFALELQLFLCFVPIIYIYYHGRPRLATLL